MCGECSACMSDREKGLCVETLKQNINHINNNYLIFNSNHCYHMIFNNHYSNSNSDYRFHGMLSNQTIPNAMISQADLL